MPKQRSPNRDKAKEIYIDHNGDILLTEIAQQLCLSEGTIRGWKAKDSWDSNLNGAFHSKNKERSKQNKERSNKNNKNSSLKCLTKNTSQDAPNDVNIKTNTQNPKARFGNQNAKGNKGGPGGPPRNKKAVTNGEFENFFFGDGILEEKNKNILEVEYDKYDLQHTLIKVLTKRERNIMFRIIDIENTPGGMVFDSVTKNKCKSNTTYRSRNKAGEEWDGNSVTITDDNTSHVAQPVLNRIMELEEALTRVQARKQNAINQLHKMQIDDERLGIEQAKSDKVSDEIINDWLMGVTDE